jgi:hypothetical protein
MLTAPLATADDSQPVHAPEKPATDWNSELELEAKSAADASGSEQPRHFGFPHRAPTIKPTPFEWDSVHTHQVDIAREGGMIIHLSDNCVMVFMPFPFAACGIGKKKANGHLLDHMQDAPVLAEAPMP